MYPRESGTGIYDQIMALCRQAGFVPGVVQEVQATTIMGLVAAGLGVTLVPGSFRSISAPGITYRPLLEREAKSALWLAHRLEAKSQPEREFLALAGAGSSISRILRKSSRSKKRSMRRKKWD